MYQQTIKIDYFLTFMKIDIYQLHDPGLSNSGTLCFLSLFVCNSPVELLSSEFDIATIDFETRNKLRIPLLKETVPKSKLK